MDPNLVWYTNISTQRGLSSRCPYANVYRCPRYYQSLSLLGSIGSATEIEKEKDEYLLKLWRKSEFWPVTSEQETSISGSNKKSYTKFCPEVLFERHGLFVENLIPFIDDADIESIIQTSSPNTSNWQFYWGGIKELHFSDCELYSLIKEKNNKDDNIYIKTEMVELKPSLLGISFNIKAIITNFCIWWLRKVKEEIT